MDRTRTRSCKLKTTKIKRERNKKKNMSMILNSYDVDPMDKDLLKKMDRYAREMESYSYD